MNAKQVESICSNLSVLLMNTIRSKILGHKELPVEYNYGEALVFWLADMLTGTGIVTPEQLRVVLEELSDSVCEFGRALEAAWQRKPVRDIKQLPFCRIGFLDRQLVCMDGKEYFLNLTTGQKVKAADNWPLETLAYNLTTLFVRYNNQIKKVCSAEQEESNGVLRSADTNHHVRR